LLIARIHSDPHFGLWSMKYQEDMDHRKIQAILKMVKEQEDPQHRTFRSLREAYNAVAC